MWRKKFWSSEDMDLVFFRKQFNFNWVFLACFCFSCPIFRQWKNIKYNIFHVYKYLNAVLQEPLYLNKGIFQRFALNCFYKTWLYLLYSPAEKLPSIHCLVFVRGSQRSAPQSEWVRAKSEKKKEKNPKKFPRHLLNCSVSVWPVFCNVWSWFSNNSLCLHSLKFY